MWMVNTGEKQMYLIKLQFATIFVQQVVSDRELGHMGQQQALKS